MAIANSSIHRHNKNKKINPNSNHHRPKQQLQQQKQTSSFTAKSTDATVFVKFTPASSHVTRQVLERWFGEIGPIRKCAVIRESQRKTDPKNNNNKPSNDAAADDLMNKGYGFVKFVSAQDAEAAVKQLHGKTQPLPVAASGGHYARNQSAETMQVRLVVDLATATPTAAKNNKSDATAAASKDNKNGNKKSVETKSTPTKPKSPVAAPRNQPPSPKSERPPPAHSSKPPQAPHKETLTTAPVTTAAPTAATTDADEMLLKKKRNRVIVRNLSFYAQEQHVRKELEERFGKIVDIHVPRVVESTTPSAADGKHPKKKGIHRGFCFVTFDTTASAQQAVQAAAADAETLASSILIHNRPVRIEWSVSKHVHEERSQQQQQQAKLDKKAGKRKAVAEEAKEDDDDDENDDDDDDAEEEDEDEDGSEQDDDESEEGDDDDSEEDEEQSSDEEEDDDDDDASSDEQDDEKKELVEKKNASFGEIGDEPDAAVAKHCCLFVRNLPFDATRHDLFEVFRSFGHITSIYLVKDRETGAPKGTAFVTFEDASFAQRALDKSGDSDKPNASAATTTAAGDKGLYLQGRRLVVHLAVDRDAASTLAMDKSTSSTNSNHTLRGKDRRNLYLQTAGRVNRNDGESTSKKSADDGNSWDDLPESDQQKRQRAFADTSTKLKSPLFFINPNRLSIRNVAKHVDETELKRLCVEATKKGLERKLVSIEDQVAHWRAQGELTPRDILQRLQDNTPENAVIPEFNEKNVKQYIPSVFIDRDFDGSAKATGMSRGFGFVEFQHHIHALACLRELNNNKAYTEEYVAGGKKAIMGAKSQKKRQSKKKKVDGEVEAVKIPRLIVEFTVENKAKAKQQIAHRAQQQANYEKQKKMHQEPVEGKEAAAKQSKQRKSRGAKQRERKRLQRDEGEPTDGAPADNDDSKDAPAPRQRNKNIPKETVHEEEALVGAVDSNKKMKGVKPPKKRKVDKEEENFDKMVNSYRTAFAEVAEKSEVAKRKEKRWFEEMA